MFGLTCSQKLSLFAFILCQFPVLAAGSRLTMTPNAIQSEYIVTIESMDSFELKDHLASMASQFSQLFLLRHVYHLGSFRGYAAWMCGTPLEYLLNHPNVSSIESNQYIRGEMSSIVDMSAEDVDMQTSQTESGESVANSWIPDGSWMNRVMVKASALGSLFSGQETCSLQKDSTPWGLDRVDSREVG